MKECQGKLIQVGVSEPVLHQLEKTGLLAALGEENVDHQTSILGDSTQQAYQDAIAWLPKDQVMEAWKAIQGFYTRSTKVMPYV